MRRSRAKTIMRIILAPLVVWVLYLVRANVWFRLYPAVMVAIVLTVFSLSLFKTPLVERFARGMGETLDARGVAYCRRVTQVWVGFLVVHLIVTVMTVFASERVWVAYNGVIAYVLLGALFAGEWIVRRKVRHG